MAAMIFLLSLIVVYQVLKRNDRPLCRNFGAYEEALNAFKVRDKNGNLVHAYLDGDNDGKPCESFLQ